MNQIQTQEYYSRADLIKRGEQAGIFTKSTDEVSIKPNSFTLSELKLLGDTILIKPVVDVPSSTIELSFLTEKYHKGIIVKLGEGHFLDKKKTKFVSFDDPRLGLKVGQKISYGNHYNKKSVTTIEGEYYIIISNKDIEFVFEDEE